MPEPEPARLFQFGLPAADTAVLSVEMRNLLEALARTHYGTDPAFPAAPRTGMQRVNAEDPNDVKLEFWLGSWQPVLRQLQVGVPAPVKFVIEFTAPLSPWVIDHNLGSMPLVQVVNASRQQLQPVLGVAGAGQFNLQHTNSDNRTVVTFSGPTAGFAILIG